MKRIIFTLVVIFCSGLSSYAQDIITKKDGTDVQAKILEVTPTEIKFKKYSNLDGPVFSMLVSDVLIVRYENGENEVFYSQQEPSVYPNMKYKEYKHLYNTHNYVHEYTDPYSPFWIGFAEFCIPGLGEGIVGEWGRAAGFFFGNLGLGLLSLTQIKATTNNGVVKYGYTGGYWAISAVRFGLNIWSICDAVHVAKVKDMYYQDLRSQRASLSWKVEPYLDYAYSGISSNPSPAAGLSLRLTF